MSYTLTWSFRNRPEVFKRSIITAHNTCPIDVDFLLVDADSNFETLVQIRSLASELNSYGRNVKIMERFSRGGLSETWNLAIVHSRTENVIFASSDVQFLNPSWFLFLNKAFSESPEKPKYILLGNHAVFGVNKRLVYEIGYFDENFKAGPHMDPDQMIRASEKNINIIYLPQTGYKHGDTPQESIARGKGELEDRLPMNALDNEEYFMKKWSSNWVGWKDHLDKVDKPHPPTHIKEAKRLLPEVDWYPRFTKELKEKYGN